ncbi:hypothetical protein [Nitrosospira sp. Is2]|uniref:hypothetical protein n=1 Tax=Nitrosospira sp. Is2 TaxID=3080532 RepID=UPI002953F63F|nr:hypothetical protein [Nitrosospira sp. Is2]WON73558.1 hypothetical protein R5L00_13920 [Nitrosospira sp. Is2]
MSEMVKNMEELVLDGFDDLIADALATISKKQRSPTPNRKIGSHHKGPKTGLRVTVDGQDINPGNANEVFATALERMGLERVSQLGIRLSGIALVSRQPAMGYQSQIRKGGWYVTTHANNPYKKRKLEEIGAALGIPVAVEIDR